MSDPTKDQIDEAREMVPIFDGYLSAVNGCPHISVHGLARLIAHVRKQARDDALERAAKICKQEAILMGNTAMKHPEDSESRSRCFARARTADALEFDIRALKDQPTGEPEWT